MMFGKQSKTRTFNYQPRFSNGNQEKTVANSDEKEGFVSQWKKNNTQKRKVKGALSFPILVFLLALLLIGIYLLNTYIK